MITVLECVNKAGLEESLMPGEVKYRPIIGEKEGTSYTLKYDHKDPGRVKVEAVAGLTGKTLDPKTLHNYAVWLQSPSQIEFRVKDGAVTDAQGTLLGKKVVGGEDMVEKCAGFFGALAEKALTKALEFVKDAVHLTAKILPTLSTMPFANALTGRTRAFAMAAGKAAPVKEIKLTATATFDAPGLGLGGKSLARKITQTRQTEDEISS